MMTKCATKGGKILPLADPWLLSEAARMDSTAFVCPGGGGLHRLREFLLADAAAAECRPQLPNLFTDLSVDIRMGAALISSAPRASW